MAETARKPQLIPAAWTAADLAQSDRWEYRLSLSEIAELDAALSVAKSRRLTDRTLTRADFPLPTLASTLGRMLRELEDGTGVMLVRDLPVMRWGQVDSQLVYAGFGVH